MNFLFSKFQELLGHDGLSAIVFSLLPFLIVASALVLSVLVLVLAERKILGYFTQRKGPNRVGPWGIFQTVADGIKILCKENIEPSGIDRILFTLAPLMSFTSIMILWCIVPYNAEFYFFDSDVALLIFYFVSSLPVLFNFIAGYSSKNKYSFIGAYRGILLLVSYSVALFLVLLSVIVCSNSLNFINIINSQIRLWNVFINIVGFVLCYICILAKLHRCPFDLTEAESELVCGFHTEYSGMRFAMFFLGEYAELVILCAFMVILFWGGYLPPFNLYLSNILLGNCSLAKYLIYFEQTMWLVIKTAILVFSIIWIRATLPRLKPQSVLNLFWKYLIPIGFINLIILYLLRYYV